MSRGNFPILNRQLRKRKPIFHFRYYPVPPQHRGRIVLFLEQIIHHRTELTTTANESINFSIAWHFFFLRPKQFAISSRLAVRKLRFQIASLRFAPREIYGVQTHRIFYSAPLLILKTVHFVDVPWKKHQFRRDRRDAANCIRSAVRCVRETETAAPKLFQEEQRQARKLQINERKN